ncbi:YveK family protein [Neobacillus vireti]|uniref:YveK family protein n=1 Tax=Neobacillus vireti TaxID=220686 RepID=UPI003000C02F
MEETISLKELLETLKKRLVMIILITMTAGLASGVISYFFLTPIYQASTQILVNQEKNELSFYSPGEVQTNLQLISTYNEIMKSSRILDKVIVQLGLETTSGELGGKITVASQKDSQLVNVSVQDPDPKLAVDIANKTVEVFQKEIVTIMNVDNVSILAPAVVTANQAPIKPQPLLNVAIALVVGLMAAVGLAFLLEYFDSTIKNEQDIEKILELPILGVIAQIDDQKMEELKKKKAAGSRAAGRGENYNV